MNGLCRWSKSDRFVGRCIGLSRRLLIFVTGRCWSWLFFALRWSWSQLSSKYYLRRFDTPNNLWKLVWRCHHHWQLPFFPLFISSLHPPHSLFHQASFTIVLKKALDVSCFSTIQYPCFLYERALHAEKRCAGLRISHLNHFRFTRVWWCGVSSWFSWRSWDIAIQWRILSVPNHICSQWLYPICLGVWLDLSYKFHALVDI